MGGVVLRPVAFSRGASMAAEEPAASVWQDVSRLPRGGGLPGCVPGASRKLAYTREGAGGLGWGRVPFPASAGRGWGQAERSAPANLSQYPEAVVGPTSRPPSRPAESGLCHMEERPAGSRQAEAAPEARRVTCPPHPGQHAPPMS